MTAPAVPPKPVATKPAAAPAAPAAAPKPAAAAPAAPAAPKPAAAAPAAPAAAGGAPVEIPPLGGPVDEIPALGSEPGDDVPALGDGAAADEPEAADDQAAPTEPVAYDFGEAPEGFEYRPAVLDRYTELLRAENIAPEVGKRILDGMLEVTQQDAIELEKAFHEQKRQQYKAEFLARHGQMAAEVRRRANVALSYATPALKERIVGSALAEDPDFNDLLAALAGGKTNDRPPPRRPGPSRQLTAQEEIAQQYEQNERARASGVGANTRG